MRTHGVDPEVIAAARARGLEVIDATCPFVTIAHQKADKLRRQGYTPVILGERDHPEVVGLVAWAGPTAVVVEDADELRLGDVAGKRVGVVVQTTQTRDNLARLVARLAPAARETLVFNTICDATGNRQAAAQELAADVDVVIVVGGRNSANTTRLAGLCRGIQPRTWHVETAAELDGGVARRGAARGGDRGRLDAGRRDRRRGRARARAARAMSRSGRRACSGGAAGPAAASSSTRSARPRRAPACAPAT